MENLSPKERIKQFQNLSASSLFGYTYDPIAKELRSPEVASHSIHGHPVVPFATHGEVTIDFLSKLCRLSPTNASIIERKLDFTLGGQWNVQRRKAESWATREEKLSDVTLEEDELYKEWVKYTFSDYKAIEDAARPTLDNYQRFGNAFVELCMYKVAGSWFAKIYSHDFDQCLYLPTPKGIPKVVQVWPFWNSQESPNSEPELVPLYPHFGENEKGEMRTMFHLKRKVPGRSWYGEPAYLSALYYCYNEIQLGEYTVNGYSNDWLPRVFLETFEGYGEDLPAINEGEDASGNVNPEGPQGFRNNMDQFFTRKGETRSRWLHRNSPVDSPPTAVHEFSPSQDYKGHKSDSELGEGKIIIAQSWHPELIKSTPGRLGGGVFAEAFQATYYTSIKPLEDMLIDLFNKILRVVDEYQGGNVTENLSIGLTNLYAHMLEETKQAEEETKQGDPANTKSAEVKKEEEEIEE